MQKYLLTHAVAASPIALEQLSDRDEPWKHSDGEWVPPSNAEYIDSAHLLPAVRIAWLSLYRTRAELEDICAALGNDSEQMVDGIARAREYFASFATVLDTAEIRIRRLREALQ